MTDAGKAAAAELGELLGCAPWLTAVGVGEIDGEETLFIYVSVYQSAVRKAVFRQYLNGFKGFPVVLRQTGTPQAVTA